MANDIQLKRSSVAGKVPDSGNVLVGEPVVNLADKIIYSKNGSGEIIQIAAGNLSGLADVTISSPNNDDVLSWNGSSWVPVSASFGGGLSNVIVGVMSQDYFIGDGSNTDFILENSVAGSEAVMVFVDSVLQEPGNNYSVSGTTLSFSAAPVDSANIDVRYFITTADPTTAYYMGVDFVDTFISNGNDTNYALTYNSSNTGSLVFVNGVVQQAQLNYYVSGNTLVFSQAPDSGANIIARYSVGSSAVDFGNLIVDSNVIPVTGQALIWNGVAYAPGNVSTEANVISVNGQDGEVVLTTADIGESGNLYYTDTRVKNYLAALDGNILPDTDNTYSLGSNSLRFKELFLSGNTLYIGNVIIKGESDSITFKNSQGINLFQANTATNYTTNTYVNTAVGEAFNQANTATTIGTSAFDKANTATVIATSAFSSSNTKVATVAGVTATTITNAHIAAAVASTSLSTITISGDINIGGNVNLTGNVTTFTANDLVLTDPLIYIGEDNTGDIVDLGLIGSFTNPGYQHSGLVRDATDGKWKLFANVAAEPTTTVDFTNATYSTLKLGSVEGDTGAFTGNVATGNVSGTAGTFTLSRLGTVQSGTWNGSSISTTYTDAKVTSVVGATGAISNAQILSGLLTVDGSGSGLDADTLDGIQAASFAQLTGATFTGNVQLETQDGTIFLGNITSGSTSTDSGLLFEGKSGRVSGIFTEVDGNILTYGINTTQIDSEYDQTAPGGIFRLDTRTSGSVGNAKCFVVKRRPADSATELNGIIIDLNTGDTVLNPSGGYTGVSTTTPSANLHVVGNVLVSSNINAAYFIGDGSQLTGVAGGVTIANTAPSGATAGDMYWDEDIGRLYIYYNDGTSIQWVEASPPIPADNVVFSIGGATGIVSNAQILSSLQSVDGSGSGLDADTLDGIQAASFAQLSGATFTGNVNVGGTLSATAKSFVIDHPTKPGQKLRYGSLEGPENGVYVRGKLEGSTIKLPEYWTKLVDPDTITVNLTPIGKHQKLFVESIKNNTVTIGSENISGDINCFYTVFAERADIGKLIVESV